MKVNKEIQPVTKKSLLYPAIYSIKKVNLIFELTVDN
jgi:hypothetical protein